MNEQFVHLHLHTEMSLRDGMNKIKPLAKKAKDMGFTAMAITDHGNMFGVAEFSKAMQDKGIKPIVGCEAYIIPTGIKDMRRDNRHIVLLAKNETGYHNLCWLASISSIDGFHYEPRIDHDLLKKHSEGLIVLSACLGGDVSREIRNALRIPEGETEESLESWESGYEAGLARALWYKDVFGEDYYLEIQDNGIKAQCLLNEQLIRMSRETGIPLVFTNDAHYLDRSKAVYHDMFMALGSGTTVSDTKRKRYGTDEFYLKGYSDINFMVIPKEAVENTVKIADKCTFQIEFGNYKVPKFKDIPEGLTNFEYLEELAMKGLKARYPDTWESNVARLKYEISVTQSMGFNDYFLIVWDFVDYARRKKYFYGPGRGSGAGSILAYCLYITHLDPIKYGLIFERFLNPSRISAADIDWDIDDINRQDMIRYVENKYGKECVGQIITFQRSNAKQAPRDAARALGYPIELGDRISKAIPAILGITIEEAMEISPVLTDMYNTDREAREVIVAAMEIEGLASNPSTHAAGVVIAPFPIAGRLPLWKTREKGKADGSKTKSAIVVQSEMGILEEQGYLKMDFLGLTNLTIIGKTLAMIKRNHGVEIDYEWLLNGGGDSPETYALIARGETEGIFQIEGQGMTQVAKKMQVANFEELTALISLYRPGPMDFIPDYIRNKENPAGIKVPFKELEEILRETYGILTYQEQVMELVKAIAHYTMAMADDVRKAIGKKKKDLVLKHREIFADKGSDRYSRDTLIEYWDNVIDPFGRYAFNKSHGASYARVAEMTAYLKHHYPAEFMAATIQSAFNKGMSPELRALRIGKYTAYLKSKNIKLVPPSVNGGSLEFDALADGSVVFGLSCIKDVGEDAAAHILDNFNDYGAFENFSDFVNRVGNLPGVNRGTVEALISAGACDCFGRNRSEMFIGAEALLTRLKKRKDCSSEAKRETQFPFLGEEVIPNLIEIPLIFKLGREKAFCSTFVSGHPLDAFERTMRTTNSHKIADVIEGDVQKFKENVGVPIKGVYMIEGIKEVFTRKDKKLMAMTTITDGTASVSMPLFHDTYMLLKGTVEAGSVIYMEGTLSEREEEPGVLPNEVRPFGTNDIASKVYVEITDQRALTRAKKALMASGRGECPVILNIGRASFPLGRRYWVDRKAIETLANQFKITTKE